MQYAYTKRDLGTAASLLGLIKIYANVRDDITRGEIDPLSLLAPMPEIESFMLKHYPGTGLITYQVYLVYQTNTRRLEFSDPKLNEGLVLLHPTGY